MFVLHSVQLLFDVQNAYVFILVPLRTNGVEHTAVGVEEDGVELFEFGSFAAEELVFIKFFFFLPGLFLDFGSDGLDEVVEVVREGEEQEDCHHDWGEKGIVAGALLGLPEHQQELDRNADR